MPQIDGNCKNMHFGTVLDLGPALIRHDDKPLRARKKTEELQRTVSLGVNAMLTAKMTPLDSLAVCSYPLHWHRGV